MLWRFGFNSSSLDTLLARETPPSIEEVMDEDDVLAECKAQNTKLVNYLSKEDAIKGLLKWVMSGLDELDQAAAQADSASIDHILAAPERYPTYKFKPGPDSPPLEPSKSPEFSNIGLGEGLSEDSSQEEGSRSRYPQIATEILTSEVWTIPDTIMNNKEHILVPFWDLVLPDKPLVDHSQLEQSERDRARDEFWTDADEDRDRRRELIRGYWTRINGSLLAKRTHEMIRFIQSLPNIVDRFMAKIGSPAVQDMLIRIISAEEQGGVAGVGEWLHSHNLIPRLIALLSPHYSPQIHTTASDLIKSIINLCAPTPFNPAGGNAMEQTHPGVRDTRLIRDLASKESISKMFGYMLQKHELGDQSDPFTIYPLPSVASSSSALCHGCNILVELVRRNNSDFSEPHLFHTLRNRLMNFRMQNPSEGDEEEERKKMEVAMEEMSEQMGIVHLGNLLEVASEQFEQLNEVLRSPVSAARSASKSVPRPLTTDRFRVVELYAELLHSSNMSIVNRSTGPVYDSDGILTGGLSGLEALGEAIDGREEASEPTTPIQGVTGDRLKSMYIKHGVLPNLVDLFFDYPANNFLHHVIYDLLQQMLNGKLEAGLNRDLVINLIKDAKLIERVLDAERLNEELVASKRCRLGYMGHVHLISEELVKFLARCPPDLYDEISDSFVRQEWDNYVDTTLRQIHARTSQPLAGGKPVPQGGPAPADSDEEEGEHEFGEPLTRTKAQDGFADRGGFDTYADRVEGDDESNTVDKYWRTVGAEAGRRQVDSSDEEDEDADWLRPSSQDDFDDDAWGTFTSASPAADSENPFGDDNFAPSVQPLGKLTPLTPHDWVNDEFDEEFSSAWEAESSSIVMPSVDEEEAIPNTASSTWRFEGNDEGEDLPPADEETHEALREAMEGTAISSEPQKDSPTPTGRRRSSSVIAPPDPSIFAATSQSEPLGPGVSSDTHVTPEGLLTREVDGKTVTVPADEVVLGVALERKESQSSEDLEEITPPTDGSEAAPRSNR